MDISNFFITFLGMLSTGVSYCFALLDSISFMGVSILDYLIWILLLSALIPIMFTIVRTRSSRNGTRPESRSSDRQNLGQANGEY